MAYSVFFPERHDKGYFADEKLRIHDHVRILWRSHERTLPPANASGATDAPLAIPARVEDLNERAMVLEVDEESASDKPIAAGQILTIEKVTYKAVRIYECAVYARSGPRLELSLPLTIKTEPRDIHRAPVQAEAWFAREDSPGDFACRGLVQDIHSAGLSLTVSERVLIGEQLLFRFPLHTDLAEVRGIVRRISTCTSDEHLYLASIEFPTPIPIGSRQGTAPDVSRADRPSTERREYCRMTWAVEAQFDTDRNAPGLGHTGLIRNLSGGGLCLAVREQMAIGDRLVIDIPLKGAVRMEGEVRHATACETGEYRFLLGVVFVEPNLAAQDKIIDFVFAHQLQMRRPSGVR